MMHVGNKEVRSGRILLFFLRKRAIRALAGFFFIIHPFPVFMNATAAIAFLLVASPNIDAWTILGLFLSVTAVHAAIGSLNDYCDFELDSKTKPDKPLVKGLLPLRHALIFALLSALLGLGISAALNLSALLFALAVLSAGTWYDLALKRTVFSWLPYTVFIPSLPLWSYAAVGRYQPVLLLSYIVGAPLSVGLNLTNTLPDLDGDTQFGVRGLAHRLGAHRALLGALICFGGSICLMLVLSPVVENNWAYLLPGLALSFFILFAMMGYVLMSRGMIHLKCIWYLSAFLATLLGFTWLVSLP